MSSMSILLIVTLLWLTGCSNRRPIDEPQPTGQDSLTSAIQRIAARLDSEAKASGVTIENSNTTNVPEPHDDIAEWKAFRNDSDYKLKGKKVTWTVYISYVPSDPYANIEGYIGSSYSGYDVIVLGKGDHPYNTSYTLNELPRVRKGDKITVTGTFGGVGNDGSVNIKALKVINHGVE